MASSPGRLLDLARGRHPAPGGIGHDRDRLLPERGQDVAIAGVAWCGQGHPRALVEQRQEGQHEPGRRARRHHHPLRGDVDAVALAVVAGDALAQRRQPQGDRVAQRLAVERPLHRLDRGARRGRARLAHLHVDDLVALRLARRRGLHHVHDDERGHRAALGRLQREHGACSTGSGWLGRCGSRRIGHCSLHATLRCREPSNRHGCALPGDIGACAGAAHPARPRAVAAM